MKILFVLNNTFLPTAGGIQRTTWLLGEYFQAEGSEVYYYTFKKCKHTKACPGQLVEAPDTGMMFNKINIHHFSTFLDHIQPNVVINQIPSVLPLGAVIKNLQASVGFKIVSCIHGSLFNFKENTAEMLKESLAPWQYKSVNHKLGLALVSCYHKYSFGKTLNMMMQQSDRLVLLATPYLNELSYFEKKYNSEKVVVIPNPVKPQEVNLDAKRKTILYVGRLDIGQKRSDLLVEFWKIAHDQLPDWTFEIVGEGSYKDTLLQQIKENKLRRINIRGRQEPEEYYRKASVFIMTSAYEGFPNVLLEAQSFGCAVVAFNSFAALSEIMDASNGVLVPPFNCSMMCEEVIKIASNPNKLQNLQVNALENSKRFELTRIGEIWKHQLENIHSIFHGQKENHERI